MTVLPFAGSGVVGYDSVLCESVVIVVSSTKPTVVSSCMSNSFMQEKSCDKDLSINSEHCVDVCIYLYLHSCSFHAKF